jgi:hypothetical protein
MKGFFFNPNKPVAGKPPAQVFYCDTETELGLYGDVRLLSIRDKRGVYTDFVGVNAIEEFKTWLFKNRGKLRGAVFYFHNLQFDISKIFGNIYEDERCYPLFTDSRLISVKYNVANKNDKKKRYIHFRDTLNLSPTSLSEIGSSLGFPKIKTPSKWIEGIKIDKITAEDIEYCHRDCEIVHEFVKSTAKLCKGFGCALKLTSGSNAMNIFRTYFLKKSIFVRTELDEMFRNGYYGGRTEVFVRRPEEREVWNYDINSMYSASMLHDFPDPGSLKHIDNVDLERVLKIIDEDEGMIECYVEAPNINIPILSTKHNGKLVFPVGKFAGSWCFPEMRKALELGYKIIYTSKIIFGDRIESPFKDFINYFIKMKIDGRVHDDKAKELFAKRMLNSIYGKFAQRISDEKFVFCDDPKKYKHNGGFSHVNDNIVEKTGIKKKRANNTIVSWAAYITSRSRVLLYQYLEANPDVLYCDTDCISIPHQLDEKFISKTELGMMKEEYKASWTYYKAPKLYAYVKDDKLNVKCKGVPANIVKEDIVCKGDMDHDMVFDYLKPIKTKTSLRCGVRPYGIERVHKVISGNNDKRIFDEDGNSVPIKLAVKIKVEKKKHYKLCPECGRIIENDKKKLCKRCLKHRRNALWDKIKCRVFGK